MSERLATLQPERVREFVPASGPSAFDRSVQALLERVEYRRCDSGEDLEAIYALRYKAYRAHDLVPEQNEHLFYDKLDDAPNCYRFGVFMDGELASTVRIHHLSRVDPFSPAMSVFDDVLRPRLLRGETFIDPSRLAADPEMSSRFRALPYVTLRLAVAALTYFDSTSCLFMIRDEHQAFYQRIFGAEQVAAPRPYASVNVLGILYESDCETNMAKTIRRFPFFNSTPVEQRMLFAKPDAGELAPLTIRPTAKYYRDAA